MVSTGTIGIVVFGESCVAADSLAAKLRYLGLVHG